MKRIIVWSSVAAIVVVAGAITFAGAEARRWCGHGWRHHGPLGYVVHELNLSDAQTSQIKSILQTERPAISGLVHEFAAEAREMDDATVQGNMDESRVQEIASRQEKVLLFTQYREMTEPLARFLAGIFGRDGLILHGSTPVAKRRELVESFQQDQGPPFFVLSLKAGGTGLNLTAASHVVHFDRWWNPAVENQATDRAFRIGQKRNVIVHKFTCRGTLEERIHEVIAGKSELAEDVLGEGGERLLTEMNNSELLRFVALDINATAED